MKRILEAIVNAAQRNPWRVLAIAFCVLVSTWWYASHLQLRSDLLELLPRDSSAFRAFEHQLGRVNGGASLVVIVESPDRQQNHAFVDQLTLRLESFAKAPRDCKNQCGSDLACASHCPPVLIGYVESGTKDVSTYFERTKWLYAGVADLDKVDRALEDEIAKSAFDDDEAGKSKTDTSKKIDDRWGLEDIRNRWDDKSRAANRFPSGYFETQDGTMAGIRVVAQTTGLGDKASDELYADVQQLVAESKPETFHSQMRVGFAGDIPNIVAEKQSILSEARWASLLAFVVIVAGLILYFRSTWAIVIITLPALLGVGSAYAFAMWKFGYVNTSGAFLGAIILGNGINYPIVLLSRYKEFRARGIAPDAARTEAVLNAFRAELVGACVAAIAYGSLTVTSFRGFSQFGLIGFVGMLLVWLSMIPVVPAMIVLVERLQARMPTWASAGTESLRPDGSRSHFTGALARITERFPRTIVIVSTMVTIILALGVPRFLADPWEYNFDKLGSRGSKKQGGAGEWSNKSDRVFGGKMNIAGAQMLADAPDQVPLVKEAIFKNDATDAEGRLVAEIVSIEDFLPGSLQEQRQKIKLLASIRDKMTPRVLASLNSKDRARVEELKPPETLSPVTGKDLPALLRRRFEEANGTVGTVFYLKYWDFAHQQDISYSDGKTVLRIAKTTDNVKLADGSTVQTASRSTLFAEMIRSLERDGPKATIVSFLAVLLVVVLATRNVKGAFAVMLSLVMGVVWLVAGARRFDVRLNFLNFIALPITFGIGAEYPFNVYDRSRLLGGDVSGSVKRVAGAVLLCSFTTSVGYGSLVVADNQALQSFGLLALSGEVACVIAAVLVLPALLHWLSPKRSS